MSLSLYYEELMKEEQMVKEAEVQEVEDTLDSEELAQEYVTAGRFMALGYADEMEKIAASKAGLLQKGLKMGQKALASGKKMGEKALVSGKKMGEKAVEGVKKYHTQAASELKEGVTGAGRKAEMNFYKKNIKGPGHKNMLAALATRGKLEQAKTGLKGAAKFAPHAAVAGAGAYGVKRLLSKKED